MITSHFYCGILVSKITEYIKLSFFLQYFSLLVRIYNTKKISKNVSFKAAVFIIYSVMI